MAASMHEVSPGEVKKFPHCRLFFSPLCLLPNGVKHIHVREWEASRPIHKQVSYYSTSTRFNVYF